MSDGKPSYEELEARLAEAEGAIDALRSHEIDAVVGKQQVAYVRLKEMEDALKAKTEELRRLNEDLEQKVAERTEVAEKRAALLRSLATDLLQAEQRERRRLSQLLHDHLQQLLTACQLRAHLVSTLVENAEAANMVAELEDLLNESVEASRTLAVELSPPVLSHGLCSAVKWLADQMKTKHRLRVDLEIKEEIEPRSQELSAFLLQAARELLFNAVKHARVREASVCVTRMGDQIVLQVADCGSGFDPSIIEADAEPPDGGSGLLNIRRRLDLLGGRMEIESSPGEGATFRLYAPMAISPQTDTDERPAAPRAPAAEAAAETATLGVLVVDDHDIVREGLVGMLDDYPDLTVVGEASDGATAISLAEELRPDVIVMDVSMPGINGIEATREISSAHPDIRIVGLSMHEEADVARRMREAGASAYATKGGPWEDLIAAIRGGGKPEQNED